MNENPFLYAKPIIGKKCFLAKGSIILGKVTMRPGSSLWFGTVARGDVNEIVIGENTNVQDLTMLHVTEENALTIGKNVSIGHNVTLHACKVGDHCLIGMGAVVLDGAEVGEHSLVAAGSLVPPNKKFPPGSFIVGSPAKVLRPLTDDESMLYGNHYLSYLEYKDQYLEKYGMMEQPL